MGLLKFENSPSSSCFLIDLAASAGPPECAKRSPDRPVSRARAHRLKALKALEAKEAKETEEETNNDDEKNEKTIITQNNLNDDDDDGDDDDGKKSKTDEIGELVSALTIYEGEEDAAERRLRDELLAMMDSDDDEVVVTATNASTAIPEVNDVSKFVAGGIRIDRNPNPFSGVFLASSNSSSNSARNADSGYWEASFGGPRRQSSSDLSDDVFELDGGTAVLPAKPEKPEKLTKPEPRMFTLLRELGSGSLGTNFKAVTAGGEKIVSFKVIRKERLCPGTLEHRVVTGERAILSALSMPEPHPYVVKYYCSLQTKEHLMMATEYLPDHTLQTLISKTRRGAGLARGEAKVLLAELALALDFLHSRDVLHGNIRPENVRLDTEGHCRLAGFNYAQANFREGRTMVRPPPSGRSKHAHTMMQFQSPELKTGRPHGRSTDWYSYGAVALFALTGLHPPSSSSLERLLTHERDSLTVALGEDGFDLIYNLCADLVLARPADGLEWIKKHPFFASVDWVKLAEGGDEKMEGIGCLDEIEKPYDRVLNKVQPDKHWHEATVAADPAFPDWSSSVPGAVAEMF